MKKYKTKSSVTVTKGGDFSLKSIIGGFIAIAAAFFLLWTNEANFAQNTYFESVIQKSCIEISADKIDRNNDNKLVAVSGATDTKDILGDNLLRKKDALAFKRTVEMYQWVETERTKERSNHDGTVTKTKEYT